MSTELKPGRIYKVDNYRNYHEVNRGMFLNSTSGYNDTLYHNFVMIDGTKKRFSSNEINVSSTRLTSEVREAFKRIYKLYVKHEKFQKERDQLNYQLNLLGHEIQAAQQNLKNVIGIYKDVDVVNAINKMDIENKPRFSTYGDGEVALAVTKYIERYAKPSSYSFLDYEYDSSLHIVDYAEAVKQQALKIPKHVMDAFKDKLHLLELKEVIDDVGLADRNTLYAEKAFLLKLPAKEMTKEQLENVVEEILELWQVIKSYRTY